MDVEAKTRFEKAAAALGLDDAATAKAWRQMRDLGLSPDQPTAVFVALSGQLDMATARLPKAIEDAAAKATATVNATAKKAIEAATASMKASEARTVENVSAQIAASADKALARRVRVFDRNTLIGAGVGAALVGLVFAWGGYALGGRNAAATAGALSSALQRQDGGAWLGVMQHNDMSAALATYCKPGSRNLVTLDGGRRACTVPLWLEGAPVAPPADGSRDWTRVYVTGTEWLGSLSPWLVLALGFLVATVGRKVGRGFLQWEPLRWLLDLPPVPAAEGEGEE